jgi:hypothetical protein
VDSFAVDGVRRRCMPWLRDTLPFLLDHPGSVLAAVCSVLAAYVFVVGASSADDAVPAASCVYASWQHAVCFSSCCLPRPVLLGIGLHFRSSGVSEVEAPPKWGVFSDSFSAN